MNASNTASDSANPSIDALLDRINKLADGGNPPTPVETPVPSDQPSSTPENAETTGQDVDPARLNMLGLPTESAPSSFTPMAPTDQYESGISETMVEELICKYLLAKGEASQRDITSQVRLPFAMIENTIVRLKQEQILGYVGQATMNDYVCKLTETGRERALRYNRICTYFGSAPVTLNDYIAAVKAQSLEGQNPNQEDLKNAFSDLLISPKMFGKLGPAVNSGKGMFLYGYPGNGKTSIAERITASFGKYVWIPRALQIENDIIRLYDPMNHVPAPIEKSGGLLEETQLDERWVRIERPTIVVGGELTMDHLEICYNAVTGISEAPVQLKSNMGTLVIDDFGRQRMSVDELLNRWIVPLEKRYDFLCTSNGKKIQVPFDQLVVFSTNLEPKDLVDDAFLRRIPYKIEVENPPVEDFIKLLKSWPISWAFNSNRMRSPT